MTKRLIILLLLSLTLGACTHRVSVCGVPAKGTPWELAAAIHDHGDGTFVPVTVYEYSNKAYIEGYLMPSEEPAEIVCDLEKGKVVYASLYTAEENE